MISRRVVINLVAFVALFVALAAWAIGNVVKLDAIEKPYTIVAEFESSPGLQPNVEATYLGVSVGSIDSVRLAEGRVRVEIDINRGVEIPVGISAAVRRKSAVGEPYIALDPPPDPDAAPIDPGEGYTVPLERTSIPLSYGQLFSSIDELVSTVPPTELGVVLDEVATALEGRGPRLREIIAGSEAITTTLASRSEVLDELATDLTRLTETIASRSEGIGSAFDDLAALTDALAASRADVDRLLDEAPRFGARVQALLEESYADLSCTFADLGTVFRTVGTDAHILDLVRVLQIAPYARDSLNAALVPTGDGGADGPYLGGSFGIVPGDSVLEFATAPTLPEPPPLASCTGPGARVDSGPGSAGSFGLGEENRSSAGALDVPARPDAIGEAHPATTDKDVSGRRVPTVTIVALLTLAALAVAAVWFRRRTQAMPSAATDSSDE